MKYAVYYHLFGSIEIEANSEEEARDKFHEVDEAELLDNSNGWYDDDVAEV